MRHISFFVLMMFVVFLAIGCGEDDEEETPTTGSISGKVTFMGEPPEGGGEIQVSIFSVLDENGRPAGPPDHYSEPFTVFTGEVEYKISGVSFGTYKLAALGFEASDASAGNSETVLGMYGFAPPTDMEADSFTVSEDEPDATGIDIVADYSLIEN